MYTRSAVLAPPTYVGLGRFQHGPNVISVHVTLCYRFKWPDSRPKLKQGYTSSSDSGIVSRLKLAAV